MITYAFVSYESLLLYGVSDARKAECQTAYFILNYNLSETIRLRLRTRSEVGVYDMRPS